MNTKEFDIKLFMPIDILTEGEIMAFGEVFRQMFNCAEVQAIPGPDHEHQVVITNKEGTKCARCRNHDVAVGRIWKWPELCWRCSDVMDVIQESANDANGSSGDYLDDPAAFKEYWLDYYDQHPIRRLAEDQTVTKLVKRADGARVTTKVPMNGDVVLEVWGNEEQMPWVRSPDQSVVFTTAVRQPKDDETLIDYAREIRGDVVSVFVNMDKK